MIHTHKLRPTILDKINTSGDELVVERTYVCPNCPDKLQLIHIYALAPEARSSPTFELRWSGGYEGPISSELAQVLFNGADTDQLRRELSDAHS